MILIIGATGLLGNNLAAHLHAHNFNYLIGLDHPDPDGARRPKYPVDSIQQWVKYQHALDWLDQHSEEVEFVMHFADYDDLSFFQEIWRRCVSEQIPLLFEATPIIEDWISAQMTHPFFWAGLRLPQVYGPHEHHLGESISWVRQAYQQRTHQASQPTPATAQSHMVYAKDVAAVGYFLIRHRRRSGVYSLENDRAYAYEEVVQMTTSVLTEISQAAEAVMPTLPVVDSSLLAIGYTQPFYGLREGIADYIQTMRSLF